MSMLKALIENGAQVAPFFIGW